MTESFIKCRRSGQTIAIRLEEDTVCACYPSTCAIEDEPPMSEQQAEIERLEAALEDMADENGKLREQLRKIALADVRAVFQASSSWIKTTICGAREAIGFLSNEEEINAEIRRQPRVAAYWQSSSDDHDFPHRNDV